MSAASYGLTLLVKDQGALVSLVNFIAIPLLLLSGITLPLTLAPTTLQNIGHANLIAYAIDAARTMVNGSLGSVSVLQAFVIFGILTVLALFLWATRSMRKATI